MPYSNSLPFTSVSEISIQCGNNAVEIFVNSTSLGSINPNFPATVFISKNSSGQNFITLKQISQQEYSNGNNNDSLRTVYFTQGASGSKLEVKKCNNTENYKITGWEDTDILNLCYDGVSKYFAINNESEFKAKIETINNTLVMVVRYGQDVVHPSSGNPICSADLYAYVCAP